MVSMSLADQLEDAIEIMIAEPDSAPPKVDLKIGLRFVGLRSADPARRVSGSFWSHELTSLTKPLVGCPHQSLLRSKADVVMELIAVIGRVLNTMTIVGSAALTLSR